MPFFWSVLFETNPNKLMGFFTFRIESWYSNSHFFHLFLLRSLFILLFCNKKLIFINFLISFGNPVYRFQLTFSCSFRSVYTVSVLFGSFSIIFSILTGVTLLSAFLIFRNVYEFYYWNSTTEKPTNCIIIPLDRYSHCVRVKHTW